MSVRAIRGATTVCENTREEIIDKTISLLSSMVDKNNILKEDIICIFFTATDDVDAEFPAVAARKIGYNEVPLMCFKELSIKGSLNLCIRVLMQFNTDIANSDVKHVYLNGATVLRPDLINK